MDKISYKILKLFIWLVLPVVAIIVFWVWWHNTLVNDGYYFYLYLFLITILFILSVSALWSLLCVPVIAQRKGYNVYAWIGLAWFLGIISYFIMVRLENKNSNPIKEKAETSYKEPQKTVVNSYNTSNSSQKKVSYSAWICPKCGEKNNYAAKNCINCFEPRP